ncbi:class I SAM-dependent methyltransferase [Salmonella enterica]|nr:class I SAM-dependent methyltransferase [Salmonella enterica]EBR7330357.1 class I SAM-dependent methyltransferase [Salmonella enterica]EHM6377482.1 class I SAM-dependent methyltransferase [Salmonella enterica]EJD0487287.1 class I SAM-dependent methyltransferase [Salmonella enterica]EKI5631401.1 class I SAM-dependent methyltransferase [Salmonella enterica]
MTSWKFYDDNAERLFSDYISLNFETIFNDIEKYIPTPPKKVLDVGAGSGRDASALADMGFNVVAVEPSKKMIELASAYHSSKNIYWIEDSLPRLVKLRNISDEFDLILISAVWMHLSVTEQHESLMTLKRLLSPSGKLIITLRLGPAEPDRGINKISTEDLLNEANKIGLVSSYITSIKDDSFNRPQIKWQKVVLTKLIQ